jgi:TPR repeat protein
VNPRLFLILCFCLVHTAEYSEAAKSKDTPVEEFQKTKARAEADDVDAQYQLAKFYSSGQGTEKNDAEAVKWYRRVAAKKDARGQSMLGVMYTNARGVERNYCQAIAWFRKAAARKSAHAQYNLGYMYAVGKGVPPDQKQASAWYLKAANQNDAGSQRIIGQRYAAGRGVDKDFVKACAWTQVVVPRGGKAAGKQLLAIESQMTPDQVTEARKLAKEISARLKKSVKQ